MEAVIILLILIAVAAVGASAELARSEPRDGHAARPER
jgi:hypothetical protein